MSKDVTIVPGTDLFAPMMVCEEHPWREAFHNDCLAAGMDCGELGKLIELGQRTAQLLHAHAQKVLTYDTRVVGG